MNLSVYYYSSTYKIIVRNDARQLFRKCFDAQLEKMYDMSIWEKDPITGEEEEVYYSHLALMNQQSLNNIKEDIAAVLNLEWNTTLDFKEYDHFNNQIIYLPAYQNEIYTNDARKGQVIAYGIKLIVFDGEEEDLFFTFINKILSGK